MFKRTIVTLIGLLAIVSALNVNLEESLFSIGSVNQFNYQLFQTRAGIIGHSINMEDRNEDIYILTDLQTKNASVILTDIVAACTKETSTYDRLHYHAATSTLLYYCINNNTLLVIDQSSFTIELTIPTGINTTFDDVRLVPQGYQIAILGMIGVFSQNPGISELIAIDLQSQTVVRHVVFNYGFNTAEAVVGYTNTTKNSLYILTSSITTVSFFVTYQVTLYSMFLIGNSYTVNNITSFTYNSNSDGPTSTELYSVGNLVTVSYNQALAVVSSEGNVLGTVQNLAAKDIYGVYHAALAVQYGNSDFYALLANQTLLKFSVMNAGYNVETFYSNIENMLYVTSNLTSSSLLFTMDNYLFNITDLKTSQVTYSAFAVGMEFLVTDTTYAVIQQSRVFIFNRETNLFISNQQIGSNYYYDENSHLISYMEYTNSSQVQCQMVQLDLQTADSYVPFVLDTSYGTNCGSYRFLNVSNDFDTPQFLLTISQNLLIYSENFGLVNHGTFEVFGDTSLAFVDYDTLTFYLAGMPDPSDFTIYVSSYNPNNDSFTLQNQSTVNDISVYNLFQIPGQVLLVSINELIIVDITTFNKTTVSYLGSVTDFSFFQDRTGAVYVIVSRNNLIYDNEASSLPGTTENTEATGGAGRCRYFVVDFVNDVAVTRFYNVCTQGIVSEILA